MNFNLDLFSCVESKPKSFLVETLDEVPEWKEPERTLAYGVPEGPEAPAGAYPPAEAYPPKTEVLDGPPTLPTAAAAPWRVVV